MARKILNVGADQEQVKVRGKALASAGYQCCRRYQPSRSNQGLRTTGHRSRGSGTCSQCEREESNHFNRSEHV